MPKVTYQTDQGPKTINFDSMPSSQDIEEVAQKQGWKAAANSGASQLTPPTPTQTPDQQSAEQFHPTFPANTQNPGLTEPLKTLGNIPSSGLQFGKGIINFMNPVRSVPEMATSLFGLATGVPGAVNDSSEPNYGGKAGEQKQQAISAAQAPITQQATEAAGSGTTATSLLNPVTAQEPNIARTAGDTAMGTLEGLYSSIIPQFFQHLASGDTKGAQRDVTNDPVGQLAPVLLMGEEMNKKSGGNGIISPASDFIKAKIGNALSTASDTVKTNAAPVSKFVVGPKATSLLSTGADKLSGTLKNVPKLILGEDAAATIDAAQNPQAQTFQSGGNSLQKVASNTADAVNRFIADSKAKLQAVKDSIPDVPVKPDIVTAAVNEGITNSVKGSADYRGIKGPVTSVDDVVNKGVLDTQEVKNVNNVVEFIKGWKDYTARGILNLKESLDRFHTNGKNPGSDAIVRSIQRQLKNVVGDVAPQIKPALEEASHNIDLADEMQTHLLGSNPATSEAKLRGIATGMDDQARNGHKITLLTQLQGLTGYDPLSELKGYHDYISSKGLTRPSILEPAKMAKYLGTKALIKMGSK